MPSPAERAAAKSHGLPRYFTGKPCKHGHVAERYASTGQCSACLAAMKGSYAATDKSREGAARRNQRWGARNSERKAEKLKQWRTSRPDLARAAVLNRRARRESATPPWFGEMDALVMIEASDLAARREAVTGFAWHVDHMIPLAARRVCGLHVGANVQVIPQSMNLQKSNKMRLTEPGEWLKTV